MITAGARFRSARVTVFVVLALGLWPANGGAGLPLKPISIVVYAGQSVFPGAQVELFFGRVGERSYMEAILSVEAQPGPCPVCDFAGRYPTDIYVGAIRPDGQFASWIGNPQAPTVVIGAVPVPLVVNVDLVETSQTATRLDFVAQEPVGLYVLYGIVTRTGSRPFDPAYWISTTSIRSYWFRADVVAGRSALSLASVRIEPRSWGHEFRSLLAEPSSYSEVSHPRQSVLRSSSHRRARCRIT